MKAKQLLAAGIVRDLIFRNLETYEIYLYNLDHKKVLYQVIDTYTNPEGMIIARILQQYNGSDLIQLFEEG